MQQQLRKVVGIKKFLYAFITRRGIHFSQRKAQEAQYPQLKNFKAVSKIEIQDRNGWTEVTANHPPCSFFLLCDVIIKAKVVACQMLALNHEAKFEKIVLG